MGDVKHGDGVSVLGDPVAYAPVRTAAGGVLAAVLVAQWMTNTPGIIQERTRDEFGSRGSDLLGQPGKLTLGARPDIEPPPAGRVAHAAPAS